VIAYSRQSISEEDIAEVVRVLRSDFLTQGPEIPRFESTVAGYCGARHGICVASGTAALHLACLALGLGPGDWLWTSPITFVASSNCALYCGAQVDFVDIDPATYTMSVDALAEKLALAKKENRLPKIVVPVHFAGQSCAMKEIHALSKEYGFKILEDASHALGATYLGKPVGSCEYSDAAVLSFHAVKMITTAEGGMVVTNDDRIATDVARLRTHGITRDAAEMRHPSEGGWYYEQIDLGYHFRITDVQAALGTSQMKSLERFVTRRREIAARYDTLLADTGYTLPHQDRATNSSWHLYAIQCPTAAQRKPIFDALRSGGIGVNVHYIPVHLQPYYQDMGFTRGQFPNAESYYSRAISIPIHQLLTDAQVEMIADRLKQLAHV